MTTIVTKIKECDHCGMRAKDWCAEVGWVQFKGRVTFVLARTAPDGGRTHTVSADKEAMDFCSLDCLSGFLHESLEKAEKYFARVVTPSQEAERD